MYKKLNKLLINISIFFIVLGLCSQNSTASFFRNLNNNNNKITYLEQYGENKNKSIIHRIQDRLTIIRHNSVNMSEENNYGFRGIRLENCDDNFLAFNLTLGLGNSSYSNLGLGLGLEDILDLDLDSDSVPELDSDTGSSSYEELYLSDEIDSNKANDITMSRWQKITKNFKKVTSNFKEKFKRNSSNNTLPKLVENRIISELVDYTDESNARVERVSALNSKKFSLSLNDLRFQHIILTESITKERRKLDELLDNKIQIYGNSLDDILVHLENKMRNSALSEEVVYDAMAVGEKMYRNIKGYEKMLRNLEEEILAREMQIVQIKKDLNRKLSQNLTKKQLEKKEISKKIEEHLQNRPTIDELINKGIILKEEDDIEEEENIDERNIRKNLEEYLQHRPTINDLKEKGILLVDEGEINFEPIALERLDEHLLSNLKPPMLATPLPLSSNIKVTTINLYEDVAADIGGKRVFSTIELKDNSQIIFKVKGDNKVRNKQSKNITIASADGDVNNEMAIEIIDARPFTEYTDPVQNIDGKITYFEVGIASKIISKAAYKNQLDDETLNKIDAITVASVDSDAGKFTDILEAMYKKDSLAAEKKSKEAIERLINPDQYIKNIMDLSSNLSSFTTSQRVSNIGVLVANNDNKTGVSAGDEDDKYGAWLSPYYNILKQKKRGGISGNNVISKGSIIGVDNKINEDNIIGGAFSFINTKIKGKNLKLGDRTNVDSYFFTVYGAKKLNDNWFINSNISFGLSKADKNSKRVSSIDGYEEIEGRYKLKSLGVEAIFGYNKFTDNCIITPMIGLRYNNIKSTEYKEYGSSTGQNLKFFGVNYNRLEMVVGTVLFGKIFKVHNISIRPEISGFINHNLLGEKLKQKAEMQGAGNILKSTKKIINTKYKLGVGIKLENNNLEYKANYNTNFDKKTLGHEATCKVKIKF